MFKLNETSSLSIFLNTKNEPVSLEHLVILLIDDNYQTDSLFRFTFFCIIIFSIFIHSKIIYLIQTIFKVSSRVFIDSDQLLKLIFEKLIQLILEEEHQTKVDIFLISFFFKFQKNTFKNTIKMI